MVTTQLKAWLVWFHFKEIMKLNLWSRWNHHVTSVHAYLHSVDVKEAENIPPSGWWMIMVKNVRTCELCLGFDSPHWVSPWYLLHSLPVLAETVITRTEVATVYSAFLLSQPKLSILHSICFSQLWRKLPVWFPSGLDCNAEALRSYVLLQKCTCTSDSWPSPGWWLIHVPWCNAITVWYVSQISCWTLFVNTSASVPFGSCTPPYPAKTHTYVYIHASIERILTTCCEAGGQHHLSCCWVGSVMIWFHFYHYIFTAVVCPKWW